MSWNNRMVWARALVHHINCHSSHQLRMRSSFESSSFVPIKAPLPRAVPRRSLCSTQLINACVRVHCTQVHHARPMRCWSSNEFGKQNHDLQGIADARAMRMFPVCSRDRQPGCNYPSRVHRVVFLHSMHSSVRAPPLEIYGFWGDPNAQNSGSSCSATLSGAAAQLRRRGQDGDGSSGASLCSRHRS